MFEPAAEVPERMRATVAENGWEIASNDAYPVAFALRGLVRRISRRRILRCSRPSRVPWPTLCSADPGFGRALEEGLGLDRVFAVDAAGSASRFACECPRDPGRARTLRVRSTSAAKSATTRDAWTRPGPRNSSGGPRPIREITRSGRDDRELDRLRAALRVLLSRRFPRPDRRGRAARDPLRGLPAEDVVRTGERRRDRH